MAKKKPLDRYVEAGKEFTEASRRCLEGIAQDIIKEGGSGREHAEDWAEELVERGRRTAEQLGGLVRKEIRHQIRQFNLATNQDVIKVVQQFVERTTKAAAPVVDAAMTATKKATGKKPTPAEKQAPAKKAAAKKPAAAKAAPSKKAPAKKAVAKKAPAGASVASKVPGAKKAAPKKAAASKKAQPSTS